MSLNFIQPGGNLQRLPDIAADTPQGRIYLHENALPNYKARLSKKLYTMKNMRETPAGATYNLYLGDEKLPLNYLKNGVFILEYPKAQINKCLYIGMGEQVSAHRLVRCVKELFDRSREDESFPGAKKFRYALLDAGIKIDNRLELNVRYCPLLGDQYMKDKKERDFYLCDIRDQLKIENKPLFNENIE